jgi:uncharacterized membrane protein YqgA involved in biofilm formation
MYGLGTIINTVAIVLGGVLGLLFGKLIKARHQDSLGKACGIAVLFIGIAGALEGIMSLADDGSLVSGRSLLIVVCLTLGALVGELINIEGWFERFGEFLKRKTGSSGDNNFVNGFLSASFTVCIGAMAIVGAIEDGVSGDFSILLTKSILDFIIIMVMTGSLGKGCIFSAIPVAILQGGVTLLARFIAPLLTAAALGNLSMIGSILIFCVGLNLVWGRKIRVANLLPAIIFAVAAAFLPINL